MPDTALTEMTVRDAEVKTDAIQTTSSSFGGETDSNKAPPQWFMLIFGVRLIAWHYFSSWATQLNNEMVRGHEAIFFSVARQQSNLWPPKMVSLISPSIRQLPFVRTEQGHQQHHHDDVLHVPLLVQVEQDAEDDDLYELLGGGHKLLADSISSNSACNKWKSVSFHWTIYPFHLYSKMPHAGCEQCALIETNGCDRKMKWIARL